MKKISITLIGALMIVAPQVFAADALTEALQKGLFEEEANHNLDAAIKAYQDVLSRADEQRRVAATALFRLAECYRKQGKTNEASGEYQRLLRDYADQTTLVNLSRQNLTGLGVSTPTTATASQPAMASTEAEEKEIRRIKAMIRDSPDLVNARQGNTTVLIDAARHGQLQVVEYLLANGADMEIRDLYNGKPNNTPLHVAAAYGHKRVVELLLAKGASVNAVDQAGRTPLHIAVGQGFRGVIDVLLTHKADVNAVSDSGQTPLHAAIAATHLELAKFLIERGANVNATGSEGAVLHLAVQSLKPAFVEHLLQKGADPNACIALASAPPGAFAPRVGGGVSTSTAGFTALHLVADGENLPAVRREIAAMLIKHKANINEVGIGETYQGWTALHVATSRGLTEMAVLLLENGADPNIFIKPGWPEESTALHMAVKRSKPAIAELLLKHGAKVDALNAYNNSALHLAAGIGSAEKVELLLGHDADPNGAGSTSSPLVNPVHYNHLAVAELLLAKGANPNVTNSYGIPLLHIALGSRAPNSPPHYPTPPPPVAIGSARASDQRVIPQRVVQTNIAPRVARSDGSIKPANSDEKREKTMFELLLEYKADPNIRDNVASKESETTLHLATRINNEIAVEMLLAAGADVNARTDSGGTALHWAAGGNSRLIEMLLARKADVNAANDKGVTPLHNGVASGLTNLISPLLVAGADINACTAAGATPLLTFIGNRSINKPDQFATVEFLLKAGADVVKKCGRELSPFEWALGSNNPKLTELLRKYHPTKLASVNLEGLVRQHVWFWEADKRATLSQALAAVGLYEKADPTLITILRDDPNTGLKKRFVYNLEAIREKRNPDVPLQDGDKIIVPSRDGASK
jgi:ankyrin repeat protein